MEWTFCLEVILVKYYILLQTYNNKKKMIHKILHGYKKKIILKKIWGTTNIYVVTSIT